MDRRGENPSSVRRPARRTKELPDFPQSYQPPYTAPVRLSLQLLKDHVTLREEDPHALAERITRAVAEVDEVEVSGALLKDCCVGEILTVERHPNADRLRVCDVRTDRGVKRVVCGGSNLVPGMTVAFAHVGARVRWHGGDLMTLEPASIRGQFSEGMICAAEELDLQELYPPRPEDGERPIVDLRLPQQAVGLPLDHALNQDDVIFHIDNHAITHRADLFSHVGFARELTALGLAEWKDRKDPRPVFPAVAVVSPLVIDCPELVPRYAACTLEIQSLGQTPDWMVRKLAGAGFRSVNLPVDITNYVMAELGTPLHAFDADDFRGAVRLRTAKAGEQVRTLDGQDRALPEGAMVLSDDDGIFDLLGIMGGQRTSTTEKTRRIYLHAPCVDPLSVRRAMIHTGLRTEAGTIYEKGVPRAMVEPGLRRAVRLFLELVPGAKITSALDTRGEDGVPPVVDLPMARVARLLGTDIPKESCISILESLGCTVRPAGDRLQVTAAAWRADLRTATDLSEEIGRISGYDAIPARMPAAELRLPQHERRMHRVRDALKEQGFTEILPLSLTGEDALRMAWMDPADAIAIENPITEDTRFLQTSTLPGLLQHAARNILTAGPVLRTFRWSHVFRKTGNGHAEGSELALLHADFRSKRPLAASPVLALTQTLRRTLQALNLNIEISRLTDVPPYAHPGRSAQVSIGGTVIGMVCQLHPHIQAAADLPGTVAVCLIDLHRILALPAADRATLPLPAFPSVTYDETISLTHAQAAADIISNLLGADPLLTDLAVTDLYDGTELPPGTYRLTLRFTYRASDRTLTEEEAKAAHSAVMHNVP